VLTLLLCCRFQELPLYFLRFFGSSDLNHVLDAMEYAVYANDVEHIILDNLQFMLSGQARSSLDKFEVGFSCVGGSVQSCKVGRKT